MQETWVGGWVFPLSRLCLASAPPPSSSHSFPLFLVLLVSHRSPSRHPSLSTAIPISLLPSLPIIDFEPQGAPNASAGRNNSPVRAPLPRRLARSEFNELNSKLTEGIYGILFMYVKWKQQIENFKNCINFS
jgi:hypothetical protein